MKNIIITGASSGIGNSIAREFLKNTDHRLFLISRNSLLLSALADEFKDQNDRLFLYPFDLIDGNYALLIEMIKKEANAVDILINNAGTLVNKPFEKFLPEDYDAILNTNLKAPLLLIQRLLPVFNKGAHVVNITSMGGFQGSVKFPGLSVYSASKGALNILTECLAVEFAEKDIAFNSLSLGSVGTPMLATAFPGYLPQTSSSSIAEYIAWFALNANKWMNGKIVPVALSTP